MNRPVIIDLSKRDYSDASVCNENDLIHLAQMERICSIWKNLYNNALAHQNIGCDYETNSYHDNNSISIFASRGAGKTTFLLSFLSEIKKNKDVLCLDVIDPSQIEMKQHPFINILASINQKVENALKKEEICPLDNNIGLKQSYYTSRNKLLTGLPFINGIGKAYPYDDWDDEEFIGIRGLERANASNTIEENFKHFIQYALQILNKKCVVIPFDDIDTDFNKGFKLLEVIRKYLCSPQIIPIITGDLELYGTLVRKAQWECFNSEYLRKEIDYANHQKSEYSKMVSQLENQYLMKLLKPEYRIHLRTVKEYLDDDKIDIKIKLFQDYPPTPLYKIYQGIVSHLGFRARSFKVSDNLVDFLTGLSLRVQMRLLTLYRNLLNKYGVSPQKLSRDSRIARDISFDIIDIFGNDIRQKASNSSELIRATKTYVPEMLRFLESTKSLHMGANFLPETNDSILNNALFAIGLRFNQYAYERGGFIFDYWTRISYVRQVTELLGGDTKSEEVSRFLKYTKFTTNSNLSKCLGLGQAYCNYFFNRACFGKADTVMAGTMRISDDLKVTNTFNSLLKQLPLVGTISTYKESSTFVSIYKMLGIIAECLYFIQHYLSDELTENDEGVGNVDVGRLRSPRIREELDNRFGILLGKLSQMRYFPEPDDIQSGHNEDDEEQENLFAIGYDYSKIDRRDVNLLSYKMRKWAIQKVVVSAQLLDRISIRFYYSMVNIDKSQKYTNVGTKLSRYITALFNSVLVECSMDRAIVGMDLNNIGDIESIFINNFDVYAKLGSRYLELFEWIIECPLLLPYTNPVLVSLIKYKPDNNSNDINEHSQMLRYHNNTISLHEINERLSTLEKRFSHLREAEEWIRYYHKWEDVKTGLSIFDPEQMPNSWKELPKDAFFDVRRLISKKYEYENKHLKPLLIQDEDISLRLGFDPDIIENAELRLNDKLEETQRLMNTLRVRQNHLEELNSKISDWVKGDYTKMSLNTSESKVYNELCEILLM